jgi:hypothetical protein
MFFRDPADLSPRAVEVLRWMSEHEDDPERSGELVVDGLECWFGLERTNRQVVTQLLECCFISDHSDSEKLRVYTINNSGKRWLKGLMPYTDGDGVEYATLLARPTKRTGSTD